MDQIANHAPTWVDIANIVVTVIVGIFVAFLANSHRRQQACAWRRNANPSRSQAI
jgi:hypothetical protein